MRSRLSAIAVALLLATSGLVAGVPGTAQAATAQPCDIYAAAGTPCVGAHSTTRALYAAYNGRLYQVRRASDGGLLDIGPLTAGGYADAGAQDAFCTGTACVVTVVYDQSPRHNDLTIEGPGTAGGQDVGANAAALPITANGHRVYGLYFNGHTGYRHRVGAGVATGGQPEGMYMVASGTHVNNLCCFDYGNAEAEIADTGNGHMDAVSLTTRCVRTPPCTGSGPWVQADLENGLFLGSATNPANLGNATPFVTALLKNDGQHTFALKGGDSRSGPLSTWWDGSLPAGGYQPMHLEGSIVLGTGGDNSNQAIGSFFEGVMTAGYPTDAADDAVQANIVAAGYAGGAPPGNPVTGPGGKCVDGADANSSGVAVQLWDCGSASDQRWVHNSDQSLAALGRCLHLVGNAVGNGTRVELADCAGGPYQKWVQQADGSLRNPVSGRCLDSPSGATANGTKLQIWDCNGLAPQRFAVNGGGTIGGPGARCVDVAGDDTGGNNAAVQLWDCQPGALDQHWLRGANSSLRTLGRCLDVVAGSTANGAKVQLYDCNGGGAQNWAPQSDGTVRNPASGRCLDASGGVAVNGIRLQIADCIGSAAQKFAVS
ncbi:arabinofuranosidase catalytic domain-containing protein [Dactylosporangium sp. NPDC051541]|uniref:arabinofuranosidase catalytic domain-containing protein n=1 Tax=Dactylosporangium sp. NPDC051541 TaxID=3363977 RepID=UPI0037A443B1